MSFQMGLYLRGVHKPSKIDYKPEIPKKLKRAAKPPFGY